MNKSYVTKQKEEKGYIYAVKGLMKVMRSFKVSIGRIKMEGFNKVINEGLRVD